MWSCPKCENQSEEGKLYCEKCGYEVQIVPDFEPELEASIIASLSTITKDIELDSKVEQSEKIEKVEEVKNIEIEEKYEAASKRKGEIIWLIMAIICALIVFFSVRSYQENSYVYQLNKGIKLGEEKSYEKGIIAIENALAMDNRDPDVILLLATFYKESENSSKAIQILEYAIEQDQGIQSIYEKLIELYEERKEYDKIGVLLEKCTDNTILEKYQTYVALSPEFSVSEDTYFEMKSLKIMGNTTGIIYYTLDGSEPNTKSEVYTTPIVLESGEYQVKALFVNEYGIQSEVVAKHYFIDVITPYPPEVNLYSGNYTGPELIILEIQDKCQVYYTIDGTEPTTNSTLYTGPISMPLDKTEFTFITYSELGVASETIVRAYNLILDVAIEPDRAANLVVQSLVVKGEILNENGDVADKPGHNLYLSNTAFVEDGEIYYLVVEFYEDGTGIRHKTESLYSVNVSSGEIFTAALGENGYFNVHLLKE